MLTKKKVYLAPLLLCALVVVIILVSCNSVKTASPTATIAPTIPSPITTDKTGAFKVVVRYLDNGKPIRQQIFMLAEMRLAQGGTDVYLPVLDESKAPKAESTMDGLVVINDIKPGKYALTLFIPSGMIMPTDASNKSIIVDIVANQVVDLGEVKLMVDSKLLEP